MSFQLHIAQSVDHALSLAQQFGADAHFIAGGTDLIIQINRARRHPHHVIDISRLSALSGIRRDGEAISIGALTTHKALESDPYVKRKLTALAEAARVVGGHQVRNIGTIGGNIANASPAADVVVALLALDSDVSLIGKGGTRRQPLESFLVGPGKTSAQPGEIISEVHIRTGENEASAFLKAGRRKAMEISVVCVAASLDLDPRDNICRKARIALGAVASRAIRAHDAERHLTGRILTPELLRQAGQLAAVGCRPLTDVRASAEYRTILVEALVPRALQLCRLRLTEDAP